MELAAPGVIRCERGRLWKVEEISDAAGRRDCGKIRAASLRSLLVPVIEPQNVNKNGKN